MRATVPNIMSLGECLKNFTCLCWRVCMSVKTSVIFGVWFERRNVDIKL